MTLIFILLFPSRSKLARGSIVYRRIGREVETFGLPAALYRRLVPSVNVKSNGCQIDWRATQHKSNRQPPGGQQINQPQPSAKLGLFDRRPGSDWNWLELESILQ
jgi:hypothetical protein